MRPRRQDMLLGTVDSFEEPLAEEEIQTLTEAEIPDHIPDLGLVHEAR